jgi:hypothetical protein
MRIRPAAALASAALSRRALTAYADPPQVGSCSTGATTAAAVCSPGTPTIAGPKPGLRQSDGGPVVSLSTHVSGVSFGGGAPGSVYRAQPSTVTVSGATPAELWSVGQDNIAEWLGGLTIGGACLSC